MLVTLRDERVNLRWEQGDFYLKKVYMQVIARGVYRQFYYKVIASLLQVYCKFIASLLLVYCLVVTKFLANCQWVI